MQKVDVDVVIIAAGAAGLTATVSAAQLGLSVLVLEKNPVTGGTVNRGMGPLLTATMDIAKMATMPSSIRTENTCVH